ncbi:MAG TPA: hypothetical protein PKU91_09915, partial [Phycisphaerales bacterium]|nr:hypothetical protein [Phycisphaerales bacterium]
AAAAALVAAEGLWVWAGIEQRRDAIAVLTPVHAELTRRAEQHGKILSHRRENAEILRAIRQGLGDQPDYRLALSEIAEATLDRIRLTDITASGGSSGTSMTLRGALATGGESPESNSAMGRFLSALGSSASVGSVDLGTTRSADVRGVSVDIFSADLRLRGSPFSPGPGGAR